MGARLAPARGAAVVYGYFNLINSACLRNAAYFSALRDFYTLRKPACRKGVIARAAANRNRLRISCAFFGGLKLFGFEHDREVRGYALISRAGFSNRIVVVIQGGVGRFPGAGVAVKPLLSVG